MDCDQQQSNKTKKTLKKKHSIFMLPQNDPLLLPYEKGLNKCCWIHVWVSHLLINRVIGYLSLMKYEAKNI